MEEVMNMLQKIQNELTEQKLTIVPSADNTLHKSQTRRKIQNNGRKIQ